MALYVELLTSVIQICSAFGAKFFQQLAKPI